MTGEENRALETFSEERRFEGRRMFGHGYKGTFITSYNVISLTAWSDRALSQFEFGLKKRANNYSLT